MSMKIEEPRDGADQRDNWCAAEEVAALIGHELRTPLTVLYSCLQLLSRALPDSPDDPARRYVNEALAEARQMNILTGQLLEATRIQAGQVRLHTETVDVKDLVETAARGVAALTRGQHIEVSAPEGVTIQADRLRMEQVLWNLLINAITYAPGTDRIDVRVLQRAGQAVIEVQDYGPGIKAHRLPRLTHPFYQAPRRDRPSRGGLGLGLFLARSLVELHGGRLRLDSQEGRGSTFSLSLPLATARLDPRRVSEPVATPPTAQPSSPPGSPAR